MAKGKARNRKGLVILTVLIAGVLGALAAVYIRVNPVWRAAELTIEPAGRDWELPELEPEGMTLETRLAPPEGYVRVPAEEGSFGEYLRTYPLLEDGIKLPAYNGTALSPWNVAAIFDISLGDEGYQQCADSIIRLYSDYFYENGQYDRICFQFSNGDECSYEHWRRGRRMLVLGDLSLEIPAGLPDDSEQQYRNYLKEVMNYAGTISLRKESETIPVEELRAGDFILSQSHVVMIADVAENDRGEKCYLIGQSFIPAVCFHIVADRERGSAWFTQEELSRDSFEIGGFSFQRGDIRRWKNGL